MVSYHKERETLQEKQIKYSSILLLIVIAVIILGAAWLIATWQSSQKVLPQGLRMAQLPMGGMTSQQALMAITEAYKTPVTVYYIDQEITLIPEVVDLALDEEATANNLEEVLISQSGIQGFINFALDQLLNRDPQVLEVQPVFDYNRQHLDAFLARISQKYDQEPQAAQAMAEANSFQMPQDGTWLDIEASRPLVVEALLSAVNREVALVVAVTAAPEATLDILEQTIITKLGGIAGGLAGIYIKNPGTGQELCYNCNIAFSGLSTLHLAIAIETQRLWDITVSQDLAASTRLMLTQQDTTEANLLLGNIGAGNTYAGAQQVTTLLNSLGFINSYIIAPYGIEPDAGLSTKATPANTRTDINANPSPYRQTTPLESGLLLESVHQCAQAGGFLQAIYGQQIVPGECQATLAWLIPGEGMQTPLTADIPEDIPVVALYAWNQDTATNTALIYGPSANLVVSVFLYHPEWVPEEAGPAIFRIIGQLSYNYFNPEKP